MTRKKVHKAPETARLASRTEKAAPTEFQRNKLEAMAVQEAIASHVVGILTHEGQNVGTGTLIRYGEKSLVLTADHVLEVTPLSTIRFAFRPSGNLQEASLRRFGAAPTPLIAGEAVETRVGDEVWLESWGDEFTDFERWTAAREPAGYVWGTNWSLAYPGLRAVLDSVQAAEWSRRLGKQMFEAVLETDRFILRLMFHSIRSRKTGEKHETISRIIQPL